jgi:hypothetical protein
MWELEEQGDLVDLLVAVMVILEAMEKIVNLVAQTLVLQELQLLHTVEVVELQVQIVQQMHMVAVEEVQLLLVHRVHLHQELQEVLHSKQVLEHSVLVVLDIMVEVQEVDTTLRLPQMVLGVVLYLLEQEEAVEVL